MDEFGRRLSRPSRDEFGRDRERYATTTSTTEAPPNFHHKRPRSPSPRYNHPSHHESRYERHDNRYDRDRRRYDNQHHHHHHRSHRDDGVLDDPRLYAGDTAASFSEFVAVLEGSGVDPQEMAERYDEYARSFKRRQVALFFDVHRHEAWFLEKYDKKDEEQVKAEKEDEATIVRKNHALFQEDIASCAETILPTFSLDAPPETPSSSQTTQDEDKTDGESADADVDENNTSEQQKEKKPLVGGFDTALRTPDETTTVEQLYAPAPQLFIKNIPPTLALATLKQVFASDEEVVRVMIGEPIPTRRFVRSGWVLFKEGTDMSAKLTEYQNTSVALTFSPDAPISPDQPTSWELNATLEDDDTAFPTKITSEVANTPRYELDVSFLDAYVPVPLSSSFDDVEKASTDDVKKALDICLAYLRRVFYFCLYCGKEKSLSAEDFLRRCGYHHFRPRLPEGGEVRGTQWESKIDRCVDRVLNGLEGIELRRLGHRDIDHEMMLFLDSKFSKLDDAKFKCLMNDCAKLFKGAEYVRKHLRNKHADVVDPKEREIVFWNQYVGDPFKFTFADGGVGGVMMSSGGGSGHPAHALSGGQQPYAKRARYGGSYGGHRGGGRGDFGGRKIRTYNDLDAPGGNVPSEFDFSYD